MTNGVAADSLNAVLQNFDGVKLSNPRILVPRKVSASRDGIVRTTVMPTETVLRHQVRCTPPGVTLLSLTKTLDDIVWEQTMEFCLRKKFVTPSQLLEWSQRNNRVRRVLETRGGLEMPNTDSLLETLAIQLLRRDPRIPVPIRQFPIHLGTGRRLAKLDLCWPALGLFVELDGQQHEDQPVYDARRQTEVTAVTGWRCGRLTWDEVTQWPEATLRLLADPICVDCSLT